MSQSLLDGLRLTSSNFATIAEIDAASATRLIEELSFKYTSAAERRWWWDNLSVSSTAINYEGKDGLDILRGLICNSTRVFLLASDETEPPWPAFSGTPKEIIALIADQHFFEYILTNEDKSWIVLDTHHNELIIAGSLVNHDIHMQKTPESK